MQTLSMKLEKNYSVAVAETTNILLRFVNRSRHLPEIRTVTKDKRLAFLELQNHELIKLLEKV